MNKKQRDNVSKYLYDISKGTFLMIIVGSFVKQEINLGIIIFGIYAALVFFIWAFNIDESNKNG